MRDWLVRTLSRGVDPLMGPRREFARLTGRIDPPRLRNVLRHGGEDVLMPWPAIVVIEADSAGAMMFRFASDGTFAGDTWHHDVEEARSQAQWEFEGVLGPWQQLPNDVESLDVFVDRELDDDSSAASRDIADAD
jgi:hypothetical protein